MKRVFQLLILLTIMSFSIVYAADPYTWTVSGETLNKFGDVTTNGSAKWIESSSYNGGVLVLNNYKGNEIVLACKGTSSGQGFAIKLEGDSVITSNKIGIVTTDKVEFIGNGTLTVIAPVTLSGNLAGNVPANPVTVTIYGKDWNENKVEEKKIEEKKGETVDETIALEAMDEEEDVVVTETISKPKYLLSIGALVVGLLLVAFAISKISKK